MFNRVVITGIGVVSSIGIGRETFWKNLLAGKSGIDKVSSFNTKDFPTHYGAEVKAFDPAEFLEKDKIESMGRASQMGICAAKLGIKDAGLDEEEVSQYNPGLTLGSTMGESQHIELIDSVWTKRGEEYIKFGTCEQYPAYNITNNIARALNFKSYNPIIPCACAAGNYAIGYAYDQIKIGRNNLMLAGGVDSFSHIAFVGFNRLSSMASEKCAPFDKNRQGIILGEGAGILVLERLSSAIERKANIYAEIMGYGLSCDAYHMTMPQFGGIVSAILMAVKNSELNLEEIDYISAHGTGTLTNDRIECLALRKIFGEKLKDIPISSIKSMIGHTMGAASAIEAIACSMAIKYDIVPPTINYETPDSYCNIDCVPNVCRRHVVKVALNNGFAFGGNNACLILKKI